MNPKAGIDPSSSIEAAKMLQDAGADVINIADGPRATVRMSNLSLAVSIQRELNMETLLHVCCRDRNFLGLQSHLLGAHVLGVQNLVLLPVTHRRWAIIQMQQLCTMSTLSDSLEW